DLPLRPILSARRSRQTDKERSECTEAGSHIETSWKRRVHKRLAWRRRWFNRATQVRDPSSPNSCLNRFFTTTGGPVPTGVDASPIKQWPAPGRLVSAGTHRLHLHCKGQGGPTLVLEAGMAGWSQDWAFVRDRLAQAGQVCSYDRAGYGWSDAAATPRNGMHAVDDLRRALDAAGIPPPYLLAGHSFGGLLAGLYARAYPKEVAGLALIDAVGRDYEAQFPPERYRKFRSGLGRTLRLADTLSPLGIPRLIHLPASLVAERLPAGEREIAVAMSY